MGTQYDKSVEHAMAVFEAASGVMRTSEALAAGIDQRTLYRMRDEGLLEPLSRGVHHLVAMPLPPYPDVAAVMKRVPRAVLCLVSALEYHEIGTQIPKAVQIALPSGVKKPRIAYPKIEIFTMSSESLAAGVEEHDMQGVPVRVFGVAKTVADCFKFRSQVGFDVALEALQDAVQRRRASPAEIMHFAKVDRVLNVIRPYVEAIA